MAQISFGPFAFDPDSGALKREGKPVALGGRAAALLGALLKAEGAVLSRNALIEAAWPGLLVENSNLAVQITALRKALGSKPDGSEWIVTVARVGYRLVRTEDAAGAASARPMLAVMAFDNLSGDPGQDYFADGVVEDLITALSRFRTFAVVSRNASFRYRGQAVDTRQVARELGVRYLLEGSVRRAGDRLRITAHLTEGETGEHLWGRTFDGVVADIFDVQDHIALHVVGVIEPQIRRAEVERSRRKRPETLDAYDLVLQARPMLHSVEPEVNATAFSFCQTAIAREPTYALAFSTAAWLLLVRRLLNWPPLTGDDTAEILALSAQAVAHADGDPEILMLRGDILIQVAGEFDEGMQLVRSAVAGNPNNVYVLATGAIDNILAGSLDDAAALAARAAELSPGDPTYVVSLFVLSHIRIVLGDYAGALEPAERAIALNPNVDFAYWMLIAANAHLGDLDRARRWLSRFLELRPGMTLAAIASRQRPRWPERLEPVLAGMRLAGLPEA